MPRIALSMIVKDEEKVIDRCLDSVLPFVDYLVIADTGSSDGTKERILQAAKRHNVRGHLLDIPFTDFATTRNAALEQARAYLASIDPSGDVWQDAYIMVMDADDVLRNGSDLGPKDWRYDGYKATYHLGDLVFQRPMFIKAGTSWSYHFPVHEVLLRSEGDAHDIPDSGLIVDCNVGGAYQGRDHFLAHAEILERYLESHPDCARSQFYLAQSYHCAGEVDKAVKAYAKRTQMVGWDEEKLVSWLRVGELTDDPGAYLEAAAMNHTRVEGLWGAANWCKAHNLWRAALALMETARGRLENGTPSGLFIDSDAPRRVQVLHHDLR